MTNLKTKEEIEIIREGGKKLSKILELIKKEAKIGQKTKDLDKIAEELIFAEGGKPAFKGYKGFPASICTSINEVVVHGIPSGRKIIDGDLVSLDAGFFYRGFNTDMAISFVVGKSSKEKEKLLSVTENSLYQGIEKAIKGNRLGDIGNSIESYIFKNGYVVVEGLCGHGIGKEVHEDPQVLNTGSPGQGIKIEEGFVFCIEPMVTTENPEISMDVEGIKTKNLSAHFEHTIAIVDGMPLILTALE